MKCSIVCAVIAVLMMFSGCISEPANPAATQPATAVDGATTQPSYWYQQDGPVVHGDDFDRLWSASDRVARDYLFEIDRTDYRSGVLTTKPLTSRQWFEFWRPDVRTLADLEYTTLSNTRRTIRFEFTRGPEGQFSVTPKVLVERQVLAEQRVTSVVSYRGVFQQPLQVRDRPRGTRESDDGVQLPGRYWYPIGRDAALEQALAESLRNKL